MLVDSVNAALGQRADATLAKPLPPLPDVTQQGWRELQLRSLVDTAMDAIISVDANMRVVLYNAAAATIFGVPSMEALGASMDRFIPARFRPEHGRHMQNYKDTARAVRSMGERAPVMGLRANGEEFPAEASISHLVVEGQSLFTVTLRDITERKRAEEAMHAASQYARSLIEASLDPLVTISAEGKITDVNRATKEVTGASRDSLIGSDFADYFTDSQKAREGYQKFFSQGSVTDYPLAIRHTSGKVTDVLYNASLYRDAKGNVLGVFAAARDITESKRMEEALRARNVELEMAKAAAEEANMAKSNFLSSMSHELRTPLNAILGFAQLIESGALPPTPSQQRCLDQILSAGWYLLRLVNEILDLAQIESGQVVLSQEAVPLEHVMNECQSLVEPLAYKRGIAMSFPQLNRPYYVDADQSRIRQVLINLLDNAIKYNKPGGTVTMDCDLVPPNAIRISVRDTGQGLSPEQLGQIFQPFNRLGRETMGEQGTGIGLVVVKRLVESMGGTIGVDSHLGVGSVFRVELNLARQQPLVTTVTIGAE